jgi:hypothetical protein
MTEVTQRFSDQQVSLLKYAVTDGQAAQESHSAFLKCWYLFNISTDADVFVRRHNNKNSFVGT